GQSPTQTATSGQPAPILEQLTGARCYASRNPQSRRATCVAVCSKRVTLLPKLIRSRRVDGTEEAAGMLSGQLFGPGGRTTPECWSDRRWIRIAPHPTEAQHERRRSRTRQSQ